MYSMEMPQYLQALGIVWATCLWDFSKVWPRMRWDHRTRWTKRTSSVLLQTDLNTVYVFASEASSDSLSTSRSTQTLDLRATWGLGCLHICTIDRHEVHIGVWYVQLSVLLRTGTQFDIRSVVRSFPLPESNTIFASGQLLELDRFKHRKGGGNRERIVWEYWLLEVVKQ